LTLDGLACSVGNILPSIPVNEVGKHFNATFGRPTKELYSMIGALILQQTFDLTDEETIQQYAFNIQWHYSLNISEDSDDAKYISLKTVWNNRNVVAQNNLEDDIFKAGTDTSWRRFSTFISISSESTRSISNPICDVWVESAFFLKASINF
jgi:hypothetical protein